MSSCSIHFSFLASLLVAAPMAPIRRFSAAEKGKTPGDEPRPLPPKKRSSHRRDMVVRPEVSRPWYEQPPPGYPLPLYARAEGSGGRGDERHRPRHGRGHRAAVTHTVAPGVHATDSSRELVMWAA